MNWFSEVLNQTTEVLNSLCDLVIKEPTYNVLKIKLDKLARKSSKYNILLTLPMPHTHLFSGVCSENCQSRKPRITLSLLPQSNSQLANQKRSLLSRYPAVSSHDLICPDFWPNSEYGKYLIMPFWGKFRRHIRFVWSRRGYFGTNHRSNTFFQNMKAKVCIDLFTLPKANNC